MLCVYTIVVQLSAVLRLNDTRLLHIMYVRLQSTRCQYGLTNQGALLPPRLSTGSTMTASMMFHVGGCLLFTKWQMQAPAASAQSV